MKSTDRDFVSKARIYKTAKWGEDYVGLVEYMPRSNAYLVEMIDKSRQIVSVSELADFVL